MRRTVKRMGSFMSLREDQIKLLDVLTCPPALRILETLMERPAYISELASRLKMNRGNTSYYLAKLETAGLVTSKYKILEEATPKKKGKAARYYSVNRPRLNEAFELFTKGYSRLSRLLRSAASPQGPAKK